MKKSLLLAIAVVAALNQASAQSAALVAARELPGAPTFSKRSSLYKSIHRVISSGPSGAGFAGAASDVTQLFSLGLAAEEVSDGLGIGRVAPSMSQETEKFMPELSKHLASRNSPLLAAIVQSGRLGEGLETGPVIDRWLVRFEQTEAEKFLAGLSLRSRQAVVFDMNRLLNEFTKAKTVQEAVSGQVPSTAYKASAAAGAIIRASESRSLDYARQADRELVGRISCLLNRRNDRVVVLENGQSESEQFRVQAGTEFEVSVEGLMTMGSRFPARGPLGTLPGDPAPLVALFNDSHGSVFGVFKNSIGKTEEVFKVGEGVRFTARTSGTVSFRTNDVNPADNKGAFVIAVRRVSLTL